MGRYRGRRSPVSASLSWRGVRRVFTTSGGAVGLVCVLALAVTVGASGCQTVVQRGLAEEYYNIGNAFFELEDYDSAIANYRRALELDPKLTRADYNLAFAYLRLNRINDAIELLEELIASDRDNLLLQESVAYSYFLLGDGEEAIARYEAVLENSPLRVTALYNLALLENQENNYLRAGELLETAHGVDGADEEITYQLIQVLQEHNAAERREDEAVAAAAEAEAAALEAEAAAAAEAEGLGTEAEGAETAGDTETAEAEAAGEVLEAEGIETSADEQAGATGTGADDSGEEAAAPDSEVAGAETPDAGEQESVSAEDEESTEDTGEGATEEEIEAERLAAERTAAQEVRSERIIELARELQESTTLGSTEIISIGRIFEDAAFYQEALMQFQRVGEEDPQLPWSQFRQAYIYLTAIGEPAEGLEILTMAIEAGYNDPRDLIQLYDNEQLLQQEQVEGIYVESALDIDTLRDAALRAAAAELEAAALEEESAAGDDTGDEIFVDDDGGGDNGSGFVDDDIITDDNDIILDDKPAESAPDTIPDPVGDGDEKKEQ